MVGKKIVILIFRILICFVFLYGCKGELEKGVDFYEKGDMKHALLIFEDLCVKNHTDACLLTASIYSRQKTYLGKLKSAKALAIACKNDDVRSCKIASDLYRDFGQMTQAIDTLEYACKNGDPQSCAKLGVLYHQQGFKKQEKSLDYFVKACYGGEKKSCQIAIMMISANKNEKYQIQNLQKQLER